MISKQCISAFFITAALMTASDALALAERGHQANWVQQNTLGELPEDWRKRLVVGKPMEQPLLERAELVYQDAEQRVVTLRLDEVLVHVRKQDKHVIAVTNKL